MEKLKRKSQKYLKKRSKYENFENKIIDPRMRLKRN